MTGPTLFHRRYGQPAVAMLFAGLMAFTWAILASEPAAAGRTEIKQMVVEEALNSPLPPSLALALAKVESDFSARALSPSGARGVMQIMPQTAREEFGIHPDELWQPRLNIRLGIDMLERLIARYGGSWEFALSHYNGGTLAVRDGEVQPHSYTRRYVEAVLRWEQRYADQAVVWQAVEPVEHDGWTPARTVPIAVATADHGRWAAPSVAGRRTPVTSPVLADAPAHRAVYERVISLDDFSEPIRVPRWFGAGTLDDFETVLTWTPG